MVANNETDSGLKIKQRRSIFYFYHQSEHYFFESLGRRGDAVQRKFLAKNFRAFKKINVSEV